MGNVASAGPMYGMARPYGRAFFGGRVGRRLLPEPVLAHITRAYERHGAYGIFLSRLLPVWRGIVPPFAGIASNLDAVLAFLGHVNRVLGAIACAMLVVVAWYVVRRLKRGKKGTIS